MAHMIGSQPRQKRPYVTFQDTRIFDMLKQQGINPKTLRANFYTDECGDVMLITKHAEIFPLSDTAIRCYVFPKTSREKSRFKAPILNETDTDEPFHILDTKIENLASVINATGRRKSKLREGSAVTAELEERLGHLIYNYRPEHLEGAIE